MECPLLVTCLFFNDKMVDMPGTAEILKKKYCKNDNSGCARFKVFLAIGRERVPKNLFPGQTEEADKIIAQNKPVKA